MQYYILSYIMIYNEIINYCIKQIDENFVNGRSKNREGSGIKKKL